MSKENAYNKQHTKGKLHAFERIERLLDPNSFHELGRDMGSVLNGKNLDGDGVITGYGTIEGKMVCVYSQDFTVCGGTLGYKHGKKIVNIIKKAIKYKCPIIGINDSGGARIQEGIKALAMYGEIFYYNTMASGYIPQISIIAGPCAGGAVYSPGLTDFIFVIDGISKMFVTGPKVIKEVIGENITEEELGGAKTHAMQSGVAHMFCKSEEECFTKVRKILDYILFKNKDKESDQIEHFVSSVNRKKLSEIVPKESRRIYDMKEVINEIIDIGTFFEIQQNFAGNVIIGFARINGKSIGIIANQPKVLAGVLDYNSSVKAARFIRFCNAFGIPLLTLVDVPGFMPGFEQERRGIIRHGAKLLYAYSEAKVCKVTVILRKAFGGAYIAMCSKSLGADIVYAWPTAEISVMGAESAVPILYGKEIHLLDNEKKGKYISKKVDEYRKIYMNANMALEEGFVDELIDPDETKNKISLALIHSEEKIRDVWPEKENGNIPL